MPATMVDHIEPHRGDWDLFSDLANTQSLCDMHANKWKQAAERSRAVAIGADGWPIEDGAQHGYSGPPAHRHPPWLRPSVIPLFIVCGPPAAGKSTYVRARLQAGDVALDLDTIATQLSGKPESAWDRERWLKPALRARNERLGKLSRRDCPWHQAWLTVSEPEAHMRQWWDDTMQPREIVVLATPASVCFERIACDPVRALRADRQCRAVERWWRLYEPRTSERVISCPA